MPVDEVTIGDSLQPYFGECCTGNWMCAERKWSGISRSNGSELMRMAARRQCARLLKGLLAGAVAGMAASVVMTEAQKGWSKTSEAFRSGRNGHRQEQAGE